MPIYEYRCQSCAKELEVLVRNGKEPEECPECQGKLARKMSRAGVIFKGSGFYVTDSRGSNSGGSEKKATSDTSKEGGSSKESGGTGETKTTASTESTSSTPKKGESSSNSSKSSKPAD